jgi:hypothetical protein
MNMDYIVTHLRREFVGCACVVHKSVVYIIILFSRYADAVNSGDTADDILNLTKLQILLIIGETFYSCHFNFPFIECLTYRPT